MGVWRDQQSMKSGHRWIVEDFKNRLLRFDSAGNIMWWHRKFWSREMTSGKLVWHLLKTTAPTFLFVPPPLVPATNLSFWAIVTKFYFDSYQPPVHSPLDQQGELCKISIISCYITLLKTSSGL